MFPNVQQEVGPSTDTYALRLNGKREQNFEMGEKDDIAYCWRGYVFHSLKRVSVDREEKALHGVLSDWKVTCRKLICYYTAI